MSRDNVREGIAHADHRSPEVVLAVSACFVESPAGEHVIAGEGALSEFFLQSSSPFLAAGLPFFQFSGPFNTIKPAESPEKPHNFGAADKP